MKNLRPFQIGLLVVFVFLALGAIILLVSYNGAAREADVNQFGARVVVWGTFPTNEMTNVFRTIIDDVEEFSVVEYRRVAASSFEEEFVNAVAEGRSPDVLILPSEELVTFRSKLQPISYETLPLRDFRDTFIEAAELLLFADGVYGLPLAIDPLVMMWNRDLFSRAGLAAPPTTWEQMVSQTVPALTTRNSQQVILQSAVAFGEHQNVNYAKETLLTLALQSGSRMVDTRNGRYEVELNEHVTSQFNNPLEEAVQFYTGFSNPNNALYSWNRAAAEDERSFISGELAMYFAPGSRVQSVINRNPNVNIDVARVPQGAATDIRRVYGSLYTVVIPRGSRNQSGAFAAARYLTASQYAETFADTFDLAPVRRSLLATAANDPVQAVVYPEALIARSWHDPDSAGSDAVLGRLIEDVSSNRERLNSAVNDAIQRLTNLF